VHFAEPSNVVIPALRPPIMVQLCYVLVVQLSRVTHVTMLRIMPPCADAQMIKKVDYYYYDQEGCSAEHGAAPMVHHAQLFL
jgi:hypothetical protein